MYNVTKISIDSDDLSIGFHRSFEPHERELTDRKQQRDIMKLEFIQTMFSGFAEQ